MKLQIKNFIYRLINVKENFMSKATGIKLVTNIYKKNVEPENNNNNI